MSRHASNDRRPTLVSGPADFDYPSRQVLGHVRRAYKRARAIKRDLQGKPPIVCGSNMALSNITEDILIGILALPNYGLRNDQAIAREFVYRGGVIKQVWDKQAKVTASGDRYPDFSSFVRYLFNRESAYMQSGSNFADLPVYHPASDNI